MRTIEAFTQPEDRKPASHSVMLAQSEKTPKGNSIIPRLHAQVLFRAARFPLVPLRQPGYSGEGIKGRRGHLRRIRARRHGLHLLAAQRLLAGKLRGRIDYFGRWKALQYYARRFYSPLSFSARPRRCNFNVYVISDKDRGPPPRACACASSPWRENALGLHAGDPGPELSSKIYIQRPLAEIW